MTTSSALDEENWFETMKHKDLTIQRRYAPWEKTEGRMYKACIFEDETDDLFGRRDNRKELK